MAKNNPVNAREAVDNIRTCFAQATSDERQVGNEWYNVAHCAAKALATETDLPLSVVTGVIAALSPRSKWDRNLVDACNVCKAFVNGFDPRGVTVGTFDRNKNRAVEILESGDPGLLNGVKVSAFARTISDPAGQEVCIDSHAYNVFLGYRALSGGTGPTVTPARFARAAAGYAEVAKEAGLLPMQVQATTWLTWKRIHNL